MPDQKSVTYTVATRTPVTILMPAPNARPHVTEDPFLQFSDYAAEVVSRGTVIVIDDSYRDAVRDRFGFSWADPENMTREAQQERYGEIRFREGDLDDNPDIADELDAQKEAAADAWMSDVARSLLREKSEAALAERRQKFLDYYGGSTMVPIR